MNNLQLSEHFLNIREHTITLSTPLSAEDSVIQPVDYVSPSKWHLAHTTWFFEEMVLKKFQEDYTVYNDKYSFLFNSYYNTIGDRSHRAERGHITRPTLEEVYNYRNYVEDVLQNMPHQ